MCTLEDNTVLQNMLGTIMSVLDLQMHIYMNIFFGSSVKAVWCIAHKPLSEGQICWAHFFPIPFEEIHFVGCY